MPSNTPVGSVNVTVLMSVYYFFTKPFEESQARPPDVLPSLVTKDSGEVAQSDVDYAKLPPLQCAPWAIL